MQLSINRRAFWKQSAAGAASAVFTPYIVRRSSALADEKKIISAEVYLRNILYTKQEIDDWFTDKAFPFAKYSAEFGWLLRDAYFKDGLDGSVSAYHYAANEGERIMINYKDKPCRINTYGDSFTQCHQVSDGETWQEVLAAHLQEPVRNYGIGGWSVYQAYLRMLKEEKRKPAKYIIFNIYDDDHRRNLDSWRNIRVRKHERFIEPTLPFVKVNLQNKTFQECRNLCPTRESFKNLADIDWVYETFKDDFVLQIMLAHENAKSENPYQAYSDIMELATTHGINTRIEDNKMLSTTAESLHNETALYATERIIDKIEEFANENNKKVLYVLSFGATPIARYINEGKRADQSLVDNMINKGLPFVDLMDVHAQDYAQHKCTVKEYFKKYFVGHYNPHGNFFCAFAIKNKLVEMLEPKPVPYKSNRDIMK